MLNKYLILGLFLFLPLVSAVSINDTLIVNTITNYSTYINQTIMVGTLNVTDEGRIEFHDLDTSIYSGKFQNTNDTYISILDFYNLIDAIIYYDNGTVLQQEFTGNINVSLDIGNNLTIINNYGITVPSTPIIGDEINQGGGGSPSQTKVNNTFDDPVLIKISNLSSSFIYYSNGSVSQFLFGDLNITLETGEFFYILNFNELLKLNENQGTIAYDVSGNENNGEITGATYNNDSFIITLTNAVDYTLSGNIFTIINPFYAWNQIVTSYDFESDNAGKTATNSLITEFATFPALIGLVGTIIFLGLIIFLLARGFESKV